MGLLEYIGFGLILFFVFVPTYLLLKKKEIENKRIVWCAIIGIFAGRGQWLEKLPSSLGPKWLPIGMSAFVIAVIT